MTLRIVFMGTPAFAVPTLTELVGRGHDVVCAYTQPPRPAGRGMAERRSPVHRKATLFNLPVRTPGGFDAAASADFAALEADAAVVVAYGLILPKPVLDAPQFGCLNLHASLLPRWRGAAPVQRAVMAGDAATGVTVMRMDEGLDTGPICVAERTPIGAAETAGALAERLSRLGADLVARALGALERGALNCLPQPADGVTHARKIDKSEARIAWARPADQVHNHVRGLSPVPGAWCEMPIGGVPERVKVLASEIAEGADHGGPPGTVLDDRLAVACGSGAVRLLELQRPGKTPMAADALLRGARIARGDRLG